MKDQKSQSSEKKALLSSSGKRVRTRSGWRLETNDMETPEGVSMTIQKKALTIRELLVKHVSGIDLTNPHEQFDYDSEDYDDIDLSKIKNMDPVDREAVVQGHLGKLSDMQNKLRTLQSKKSDPAPQKADSWSDEKPETQTTKSAKLATSDKESAVEGNGAKAEA